MTESEIQAAASMGLTKEQFHAELFEGKQLQAEIDQAAKSKLFQSMDTIGMNMFAIEVARRAWIWGRVAIYRQRRIEELERRIKELESK